MSRLDIIGDIHGQLETLRRLGVHLGYDVEGDWGHPDDRRLVFVGDLIDRGPHSFEVADLVRRLCAEARAVCLLGNHEFNLIEWHRGRIGPKNSNRSTVADVEARPSRWQPIFDFFESLPLAVELSDLRVTHAVWHQPSFDGLAPALSDSMGGPSSWPKWAPSIALHAPYDDGELRVDRAPLDIFLKGYETKVQVPFRDNDGALRHQVRAQWWREGHSDVPRDRRIIFGHYWNLPPIPGRHDAFVPPFPSGHPDLRSWFGAHHEAVSKVGREVVPADVSAVCIDFNGVTRVGVRACVGAYRYPEAEVAWASFG